MGQLLTTDQRDFEGSGALAWTGASVTLSRDAVAPIVGAKSLKAVSTASGVVFWWPSPDPLSISPGIRTFHATAQFKGPAGRAMQLWVRRWHANLVTYTDSVHNFTSTGSVQPISGRVTTAIDTPAVSMYVLDLASVLGDSYWLDSVSFTDEVVLASYSIELGLAAQPLDALSTVVWTEVKDDLLKFGTSRGRSRERTPIQAGTATVTLDNASGAYDPMNSTGAYWPNLKPMKRLRISATYEGVTYRLFTGYVDEFRVNRPNAHYSTVTIKATDGFKLLNLLDLIDPYEHAVLAADPKAFYRFTETGSTPELHLRDQTGNGHSAALYNPKVEVNGFTEGYEMVSHATAPSGRAVKFWDEALINPPEGEYAGYGLAQDAAVAGTGDFSISFMFERAIYNDSVNGSILAQCNQDAFGDPGDQLFIQDVAFANNQLAMRFAVLRSGAYLLDQTFFLGWYDGGVFTIAELGKQGLDHVIITRSGDDFEIRVRPGHSPEVTGFTWTFTASAVPNFASDRLWIGTSSGHTYLNGVFYTYPGQVAELATYPSKLSNAQMAALEAALFNWVGDLPWERLHNVLNQVGLPLADRSFEAGVTELMAFDGAGASALSHLQDVAEAEDGIFFFSGAGVATFYGRHHLIASSRSSTSQVLFGDAAEPEVPYEASGLDPAIEENDIYNEAIVARKNGLPQRAVNDTSVSAYGRRTLNETDLIAASDNDMAARAVFRAEYYSVPVPRTRSLSFTELDTLGTITANYPPALGMELWDRVTYRQQLSNAALWEQESIVEGLAHDFDGETNTLRVSVALSSLPASLSEGGFFMLDFSQLDVAKLAY